MARMKFLLDSERCNECNACVTACKNENEVPWGINRRRVVTINDGKPGERSVSVACMHCSDAPCMAVCPVDVFYQTKDGVVLHSKDLCIGCGYCLYACPFGAPQYPQAGNFGTRGKMDKCTFCNGGTGATGSRKASCRSVRSSARPRRCWPAMATRFPTSIGNASPPAASARVLGVGATPTGPAGARKRYRARRPDPGVGRSAGRPARRRGGPPARGPGRSWFDFGGFSRATDAGAAGRRLKGLRQTDDLGRSG
jgi:formate dehydrogenase iron-sulfur subunit